MAKDPNDLFEIHGIDVNAEDPNDLFQQSNIKQNKPYQMHMNQERQNTIPGGFVTHLGNLPAQYINPLLARARELGESTNSPFFLNKNKPVTQIPDFAEPENPSAGYNIGHALGYAPEVAMYGPTAYKLAKYGIKGIGKGIDALNPHKTLNQLRAAYSEEAIQPRVAEGLERYEQSVKSHYAEPFTKESEYLKDVIPRDLEDYARSGRKLHTRLSEDMNIEGAHKLKKHMNKEKYEKLYPKRETLSGLDTEGGNRLEAYETLGDLLKKDIHSSLAAKNPEAAAKYLEADINWAKNVHPHSTINKILKSLSHESDYLGKQTAKKIIKRSVSHPSSVPSEALEQAKAIMKRNKNLNIATGAATGLGVPYGVYRTLKHLIGS